MASQDPQERGEIQVWILFHLNLHTLITQTYAGFTLDAGAPPSATQRNSHVTWSPLDQTRPLFLRAGQQVIRSSVV